MHPLPRLVRDNVQVAVELRQILESKEHGKSSQPQNQEKCCDQLRFYGQSHDMISLNQRALAVAICAAKMLLRSGRMVMPSGPCMRPRT